MRIYFPFFIFSLEEMKAADHLGSPELGGSAQSRACFQLVLCNVLMKPSVCVETYGLHTVPATEGVRSFGSLCWNTLVTAVQNDNVMLARGH